MRIDGCLSSWYKIRNNPEGFIPGSVDDRVSELTIRRKKTKPIFIGDVQVGGDAPVVVQSMTSTDTRNVELTVAQIRSLEKAGCELIRVAVPDHAAASVLSDIKQQITIPLIADVHFHYELALEAIASGVDGIRINPGNIRREKILEIAKAARLRGTAIRLGVNSGSLEKDLLGKYGGPVPEALVESAMRNVTFLREAGVDNVKISVKSSDVRTTIAAYRALSERTDCPLHVGVTEAGSLVNAAIKSSLGIGVLLLEGIGDTIRVSVTGDPVSEIGVAFGILRSLGLRKVGPDIISCPTCGRCEIDLCALVREVEEKLMGMKSYLKIALMGCVVNGPGEAAEADVGIAGGRGVGLLFRKGTIVKKVRENEFVKTLLEEIESITGEKVEQ